MLTTQVLRWGFTMLMVLIVPASIYLFVSLPTTGQKQGVIGAVAFFAFLWLVDFIGFAPPSITVSPARVTVWGDSGRGSLRQRIRRSDLAYIFRGQGLWGRGGFAPAYFLVTSDDTPQILISAADFADDGMVELAKRLNVPIKGDFSAQVR